MCTAVLNLNHLPGRLHRAALVNTNSREIPATVAQNAGVGGSTRRASRPAVTAVDGAGVEDDGRCCCTRGLLLELGVGWGLIRDALDHIRELLWRDLDVARLRWRPLGKLLNCPVIAFLSFSR